VLLGILSGSREDFAYGGITLCADDFHRLRLSTRFYFLSGQQLRLDSPATPITQRLLALTRDRFGLFPFRPAARSASASGPAKKKASSALTAM